MIKYHMSNIELQTAISVTIDQARRSDRSLLYRLLTHLDKLLYSQSVRASKASSIEEKLEW